MHVLWILLMTRLRLHAHDDFDHIGTTHRWRCQLRLLQLREFAWQSTDVYFGDSATAPAKINLQLLRLRDNAQQLVGNYFNYSVARRRLHSGQCLLVID